MTVATDTEGTLEYAVGSMSRGLARRITRRSAMSRLGRYGVALSLGAAGAALLDDTARAATTGTCCQDCRGGCCSCESTWCDYGGECPPSGSCRCGAWWGGCYCSGGRRLMYGDCCGSCGCGSYCTCGAFDCSSGACGGTSCRTCPSCCHQFQHVSDTNRQCGDCSTCSCPWYVNCRRAFCQ